MTTFITLVCACRCRLGKATSVGARDTEGTATPTSGIRADILYSCTVAFDDWQRPIPTSWYQYRY